MKNFNFSHLVLFAATLAVVGCSDNPNKAQAPQTITQQSLDNSGKTSTDATPAPLPVVLHPAYANVSSQIFAKSCVSCHRPAEPGDTKKRPAGGILLNSYESIKENLDDAANEIYTGDMPPKNPLADDKIALLARWIAAGAPENVSVDGTPVTEPTPVVTPTATPEATATPIATTTPVETATPAPTASPSATPIPSPAMPIIIHPSFADVNSQIFMATCLSCHRPAQAGDTKKRPAGGILLDSFESIKMNIADAAKEIGTGDMPPRNPLSDDKIALLSRWIADGAPENAIGVPSATPTATPAATPVPTPVETPAPTATPAASATPAAVLTASYASIHEVLLKSSCLNCHGVGQKQYAKYPLEPYASLMATKDVVKAGDADNSSFYSAMESGDMPTDRSKLPKVTADQLSIIKQWITNGALDN